MVLYRQLLYCLVIAHDDSWKETEVFKHLLQAPGGLGSPLAWLKLVGGLFAWALAVVLMVKAGLGLGPWDLFHQGVGLLIDTPLGLASIYVSVVIVLGSLRLQVRPGLGTLANMVLIGVFIDLLMPLVPVPAALPWRWAWQGAGIALVGLGSGLYIGARMGAGPRDALMLALSTRLGWPVRRVRTAIELCALAAGWALGGQIGSGTVAFALLVGPSVQLGLRLCHALPAPAKATP